MTEQELQAIEERWRKATPGNWGWIIRGNSVQSHAVVCHDDAKSLMPQNICSGISPKTGNAEAIAHAPTDIAALLAEVRRLNESKLSRVERMMKALETIRRCVSTRNTPIETVNAMDRIAAEALDGLRDKEEKQ